MSDMAEALRADPIILDYHPEFRQLQEVQSGPLLIIPSQGLDVRGEGEMLYEQRHAGNKEDIFVSRCPLPAAEADYRQSVFEGNLPLWLTPSRELIVPGMPLDEIVLSDRRLLDELGELTAGQQCTLSGFDQTPNMELIAEDLGVWYHGNANFAASVGGKHGLNAFLESCDVPTPHTWAVSSEEEAQAAAAMLRSIGYETGIVKKDRSTGGMGNTVLNLERVLAGDSALLPPDFTKGVIQGCLQTGVGISFSAFVSQDVQGVGVAHLTEAHLSVVEHGGYTGAKPIGELALRHLLPIAQLVAAGYAAARAWGPHNMDTLLPTEPEASALSLPWQPLCHDENTRPGAVEIAKGWVTKLRAGYAGIGWHVEKVNVPVGTKIAEVIGRLREAGMLLKEAGPEAHGVFVFNGGVLDYGEDHGFYAIAVSKHDDPAEADSLIASTQRLFGGE